MTENSPEPVMLSSLQHYLFCPRQCALIHVEGVWRENYLTASGRQAHVRVDRGVVESRRDTILATALPLCSHRVGLVGVADAVEFHRRSESCDTEGRVVAVALPGHDGLWTPFPVEYKRGLPKDHHADEVQLCGQAICLEEMFDVHIAEGDLFYGENHRRQLVVFDSFLRQLTEATAQAVRELVKSGTTPEAVPMKECNGCSLKDLCLPRMSSRSVTEWLDRELDITPSEDWGVSI